MTQCAPSLFHQSETCHGRDSRGMARFLRRPSPKTGPLRWTAVWTFGWTAPGCHCEPAFSRRVLRVLRGFLAKCEQVSLLNLIVLKFRSQSARLSESGHCGSPQPHFKPPVCGSSGPRDTTGDQKQQPRIQNVRARPQMEWTINPHSFGFQGSSPTNPCIASSRGTPKLVASLLRLHRNSIDCVPKKKVPPLQQMNVACGTHGSQGVMV